MNASDYRVSSARLRILEGPGMWVGEIAPTKQNLYALTQGKIVRLETYTPPAFQRIYMEVFGNTIDNAVKSRLMRIDPGCVTVTFTPTSVTVYNEGLTIPIAIGDGGNYVPQNCFGVVLSGSNFGGKRNVSGINGIGAKATNIFSKKFSICINSVQYGATYVQHWANNMDACLEPNIQPYHGSKANTSVYFEPDFNRFQLTHLTDEIQAIFAFFSLCGAMTCRIPLSINGTQFSPLPLRDFARTYISADIKNMLHVQRQVSAEISYEILIFESKDEYKLAFVNGLFTPEGVHVRQPIEAFCSFCVKAVAAIVAKGKKKDTNLKGIDNRSVRKHIGFIINAWLPNPSWDSQAKTRLSSYHPPEQRNPLTTFSIEYTDAELEQVKKWNLLASVIEAYTNGKIRASSSRKLEKRQILKKCTHANFASGNWERRRQCTLIITEGESAVGYYKHMKALNPYIMDTHGVLPFRGKCLNVYNATPLDYLKNQEFTTFAEALNLSAPGTDYTLEENFRTLRYGQIMTMADSDVDGNHIKGLLLTLFYCKYPTLLQRGFVQIYLTPILRASKGPTNLAFYNASSYRLWIQSNGGNTEGWKVRYYKGLGTSNREDVKRDCMEPRRVTSILDRNASVAFRLGFSEDCADMRKVWIYSFDPLRNYETPPMQPVSDFINYELIEYSVDNLNRSIPSLMDGQKRVQRKILYGLLRKKDRAFAKVMQLALMCAKVSGYHNGDSSISDALIAMCANYVGSNNLPLIEGSGSFATRDGGDKDAAAARYPDARLALIVTKIFRAEDNCLLVPTIDECKKWEPHTYYPIINMAMINGPAAIGSGYNTFIPCHGVADVMGWILSRLSGQTPQDIKPWYRGYKGEIVVERVPKKKKGLHHISDDIKQWALSNKDVAKILSEIDSEEDVNRFTVRGIFQYNEQTREILITELPIYTLVNKYLKFLGTLIEEEKIKNYRDLSAGDNICITLIGWNCPEPPTYESLNLIFNRTLSNMYLLDSRGMPRYYPTTSAIMEAYYVERLAKYLERKNIQLRKILEDREELIVRRKYIRGVIVKEIDIFADDNVFRSTLESQGIPYHISEKVRSNKFVKQAVITLDEEIIAKEKEYRDLDSLSPEHMWYLELQELQRILQTPASMNDDLIPS